MKHSQGFADASSGAVQSLSRLDRDGQPLRERTRPLDTSRGSGGRSGARLLLLLRLVSLGGVRVGERGVRGAGAGVAEGGAEVRDEPEEGRTVDRKFTVKISMQNLRTRVRPLQQRSGWGK